MRNAFVCLSAVLVSLGVPHTVHAQLRVWTTTETWHALRSDAAGDERLVKVGAARNEWVSLQILVRSDEEVKGVGLEAGELKGPGGAILSGSESRCYRQHQLYLEIGTYRNSPWKPGWYPDPLIPFEHPTAGRKLEAARFVAVPFDLPAGETHGFWVDVYIPASVVAGDYHGAYRVTCAGAKTVEVPVTLTVWDFVLPDTPTLATAFGSPAQRMRSYYRQRAKEGKEPEPSDWQAVEDQCAQLLSEHRINATPASELLRPVRQDDGAFQIPSEHIEVLREFIDRYHVNALQIPHPSSVIKDPEAQREILEAWLVAFDQAARELDRPGVVFFIYLKDEPNTEEDYRYVQKWGRAVRRAKSAARVLVVEQTWTEAGKGGADSTWGDLYGAVDIWCPLFSLHRHDSAARRQALGETIWTYTALCQGEPTPWWHIDYPLLNYRVPAWMAWRDRMKGLLYWGGMSYWTQTDDPWEDAPIYISRGALQQGRKDICYNGEGSLVYPARAVGYDGIVPTVRLKALRDGIEDYEYLAILQRLGKSAEAERIVRALTDSWFQWDKDPRAYEEARAKLAAMIVATMSHPDKSTGARGPLRVHPANSRYFTDGSTDGDGMLKAVYLTGAHTWNNLVDMGRNDPPEEFDFSAYLDSLERHHHNFIRLWAWDSTTWDTRANGTLGKDFIHKAAPLPWARTGPGNALDGKPKFDLTRFEPAHFERLRSRVAAAGQRGIYVSVMLFEGWGLMHGNRRRNTEDGWAWRSHPFNPANNINGVQIKDADDLSGRVHTLGNADANKLQAAYIRRVVDTVNDLDNVLYEVINEGGQKEWDWWVVQTVKDYEQTKPKQHPVGITGHGAERLDSMLASPADWISPGSQDGFRDPPPAWEAPKVSVLDTDHVWGVGGNPGWVWKSFLRGHNPIFMDPYDGSVLGRGYDWEPLRAALGHARRLAERLNLASMVPHGELASSGFCLSDAAKQYVVYAPEGEEVTVDMSAVSESVAVEWIHPTEGTVVNDGDVSGGTKRSFRAPFAGDAVLYLRVK